VASGAALLLALLIPQTVPQTGGMVIFAPRRAAELLHQCSRSTPKRDKGGWTPSVADIARFEAKLSSTLPRVRMVPDSRKKLEGAPKGWIRQYVGIVRGGKRYIYGNFAPASIDDYHAARRKIPIAVCDGGPSFFGAEYDVQKDAISDLGFNGIG